MNYTKAKEIAINKLQNELCDNMYYHNISHTLYVCEAARIISVGENITGDNLTHILTAAMFHDIGFINSYNEHEKESAIIAKKILNECDYSTTDIEIVCDIILATEMPQKAKSIAEKIICDSDLYYLGDKKFYIMGLSLYQEWYEYGICKTIKEWYELQYSFLCNHSYYTSTAQIQRDRQKEYFIKEIKELLTN